MVRVRPFPDGSGTVDWSTRTSDWVADKLNVPIKLCKAMYMELKPGESHLGTLEEAALSRAPDPFQHLQRGQRVGWSMGNQQLSLEEHMSFARS